MPPLGQSFNYWLMLFVLGPHGVGYDSSDWVGKRVISIRPVLLRSYEFDQVVHAPCSIERDRSQSSTL